MAKVINGATKRGQSLLDRASVWEGRELWEVYGNVSSAKMQAMEKCKEWCYRDNGRNFHICSHNSFQFSVAWEYDNPETGELMTRIETANSTYIVDGTRA